MSKMEKKFVKGECSSIPDDNECFISWKKQFEKAKLTKDYLIKLLVKSHFDKSDDREFLRKQVSSLELERDFYKQIALELFEYK